MMTALQLAGMRSTYDEIVATGIKRLHGIEREIGALPQGRDRRHAGPLDQLPDGIATLPMVKGLADLELGATPINAELIEQLGGLDGQQSGPVDLVILDKPSRVSRHPSERRQ
jgi:hypothetical protein